MPTVHEQPPRLLPRDLVAAVRSTTARERRDQVPRYFRYVRTLVPLPFLMAYAVLDLLTSVDPAIEVLGWLVAAYLAGIAYEALVAVLHAPILLVLRASLLADTVLVAGAASALVHPEVALAAYLWPVLIAAWFLTARDVMVVTSFAAACYLAVSLQDAGRLFEPLPWGGAAALALVGGYVAFLTSVARWTERQVERERALEDLVLRFTERCRRTSHVQDALRALELDLRRTFALTHAWVDLVPEERTRRELPGAHVIPVAWDGETVARITVGQAGGTPVQPDVVRQLERVATFIGAVMERLDAERTRAAADERLREADQLKDRFLALAGHELRTPLTSIRGFSETMSRQWEILADEDKQRFLAIVVAQSERLARLVEDLLLLSGMQSGRLQPRPVPVVVEDAVERCVQDLGIDDVVVACDPAACASTDPDHLAQILATYLDNAVQHGAGPIEVSCEARGGAVTISVSDSGAGVAEDFVPRLFGEFQRDRNLPGIHGGSGLGLSIVRTLARAYGGDAWHEPNWPNGARFLVRLPAAAPMRRSSAG